MATIQKNSRQKKGKTSDVLLFGMGLAFALLWSSASTATKFALREAQPFVICIARFFTAGIIMLFINHVILRNRLPQQKEWGKLAIYGLLNISVYLGLFVLAMQHISPGLASLSIATNPVFISIISALFFKEKIEYKTILSLLLCSAGVLTVAYPLFQNSFATPVGLLILLTSMLSYSAGVLFFSKQHWNNLHMLTINGWQTMLGGIFLLPIAAFFYEPSKNTWNSTFIFSVLWLAIPVSLVAVQLWLLMLRKDAVRASFWLFLCPVSGYMIASIFLNDPIGIYTIFGMLLVLTGLYLVQKKKPK